MATRQIKHEIGSNGGTRKAALKPIDELADQDPEQCIGGTHRLTRKSKQVGHTPGPWSISHHPEDACTMVSGPSKYPLINGGSYRNDIALLWNPEAPGDQDKCSAVAREVREANARLIAAAPELLKQLKGALFVLENYGQHQCQCENIRSAIAKATGGDA